MPHRAVEIGRVASAKDERGVIVGVDLDGALQHEDELLTFVPDQRTELLQRGGERGPDHRNESLPDQVGTQVPVVVGRGQQLLAATRAVDAPPGRGRLASTGGRKEIRDVGAGAAGDLEQLVVRQRDLAALDFRQGRDGQAGPFAQLGQRPPVLRAQGAEGRPETRFT